MKTMMQEIVEALQPVDAELHFDQIHRQVYSVDASIYEVQPLGIVIPRTKQALIDTLRITQRFQIAVTARGAATGITGGCLGEGLIIDTSKYLNKILEINLEQEYVICEPGLVQDCLNAALAPHGYRLGPDTSTGNRATLGGMLANNAAGARSLYYGTMADHILSVELALANGELLNFSTVTWDQVDHKASAIGSESEIYRTLKQLRSGYAEEIQTHFPQIPRNASGYRLLPLLQPKELNPCQMIAGSEGTLGMITKMQLKIVRQPEFLGLCILVHHDLLQGMQAIGQMLSYHPTAVELIDSRIIHSGRQAPSMRDKLEWLKGDPAALFVIEFHATTKDQLNAKLDAFATAMKQQNIGYEWICMQEPSQMAIVWELRKAGLGLLLSKRSYSRAIAFLEDLSIPPENLGHFMEKFSQYLKQHGREAGIYGHAGSGCMHIRPYVDLRKPSELQFMEKMMLDITEMVVDHGGVLSGEHGDGRIRSWLNRKLFGERLYSAFLQLKAAFDPENRMNPGKIVNGTPLLEHLRLDPKAKQAEIKTFLDFSKEGGFHLAVDLCNGNGLCRKQEKLMCPSFQVTGDEFDTTRARAQALREIVNGRVPIDQMASAELYQVLDLCLECKGCKTECPSEVNMAKMKAEFLYHYQQKHGISWRSHLFGNIGLLSELASPFASVFNHLSELQFTKKLLAWLKISSQRALPKLSSQRLSRWFANRKQEIVGSQSVVLFNDTYTEFYHPEVGMAAVKVLESLGYRVIVPPWQCCGRPAISKGLLPKAKKMAGRLVSSLHPYAEQQIPIIGLEPSCLFAITDDFFGLLGKENSSLKNVASQSMLFDQFLVDKISKGQFFNSKSQKVKVHGHCHQKALIGMKPTLEVLNSIAGFEVAEIPSGCCGMAGSFGYEKEHAQISMQIGELKLFPAIRAADADTLIVANGFSCRSQVNEGTGRRAFHLAELLANTLCSR